MPWTGSAKFALGIFTVLGEAPRSSGVYALFARDECVYVGEAENIQVHLLRHLNGPDPCVLRTGVTTFAYECVAAEFRRARQQELIEDLSPVCQDCPYSSAPVVVLTTHQVQRNPCAESTRVGPNPKFSNV